MLRDRLSGCCASLVCWTNAWAAYRVQQLAQLVSKLHSDLYITQYCVSAQGLMLQTSFNKLIVLCPHAHGGRRSLLLTTTLLLLRETSPLSRKHRSGCQSSPQAQVHCLWACLLWLLPRCLWPAACVQRASASSFRGRWGVRWCWRCVGPCASAPSPYLLVTCCTPATRGADTRGLDTLQADNCKRLRLTVADTANSNRSV